jgi:hypothetical protein
MEDWIEVERFEAMEDKLQEEMHRLGELAMDLALNPGAVIKAVENENGFSILVHKVFYKSFT